MKLNSYFKRTTDNFQPNIPGDLVSVMLGKLAPDTDEHRVGVWGDDDFGMVKDFDTYQDAQELFLELTEYNDITKQLLLSLDFEYF